MRSTRRTRKNTKKEEPERETVIQWCAGTTTMGAGICSVYYDHLQNDSNWSWTSWFINIFTKILSLSLCPQINTTQHAYLSLHSLLLHISEFKKTKTINANHCSVGNSRVYNLTTDISQDGNILMVRKRMLLLDLLRFK